MRIFVSEQLSEIKKMTMAKVICMTGLLTEIMENAFNIISDDNPVKRCSELGDFNFQLFKDDQVTL